jgi:ubiquitin-protein ligase
MSGRWKHDRLDWPHTSSPTRDEDEDYEFALKLSAELNGDTYGNAKAAPAAAAKLQADRDTQHDADFDLAIRMQFADADNDVFKASERTSPYLPDAGTSSRAGTQHKVARKSEATVFEYETLTIQEFRPLPDFQVCIRASECVKCGSRFFGRESDIIRLFKEWHEIGKELSTLLQCRDCGTYSCIACPSSTLTRTSSIIFENRSVSWCCNNGRLLLIWILLCGFDVSYCEAKVSIAETMKGKKKPAPPPAYKGKGKDKVKTHKSNGVGYSGIGYGGYGGYEESEGYLSPTDFAYHEVENFQFLPHPHAQEVPGGLKQDLPYKGLGKVTNDKRTKAYKAQMALDKLATTVLRFLQYLLPSLDRGLSFNTSPPAMLADMLLESKILAYTADLLCNDSLDDIASRRAPYEAVLDFIQVIGLHPTTASSTVFSERPEQPQLCNLLTKTYRHDIVLTETTVPAIAENLCGLSKLGDLLLKNAKHHTKAYDTESDRQLVSFCRRISELWKTLSLSAHVSTQGSKASKATPSADPTVAVANVSDIADDKILASHSFKAMAEEQAHSAPGRLKRLVYEISILKSSLPPNIFVRHGEARLDVMKCIIIGPEGTPYEDGMFEFDIYCPLKYPNVPPIVTFKGTGKGCYGINPNLYADGKVCLSLLGTWPGESWKPGVSTILQVLVSLQAMVFCDYPWFNEPGREETYGMNRANKASESYNLWLRELTVELAMLNWIKDVPLIWWDVVDQHFRSNADKILRTVIQWSKHSRSEAIKHGDGINYAHLHGARRPTMGYNQMLPQLHQGLQMYGATVALPEEAVEPHAKKPRVEDSRAEASVAKNHQGLPVPQHYYEDVPGFSTGGPLGEKYNFDQDFEAFMDWMAPTTMATRGGYSGRGAHDAPHSFGGRGQVPAAGHYPPTHSFGGRGLVPGAGHTLTPSLLSGLAPMPDAPGGPPIGRGRGRGVLPSMIPLGRGRGFLPWTGGGGGPTPSSFESYHLPDPDANPGNGRRLGGDDEGAGRGGGPAYGGRGGHGGRGGGSGRR